MLIAAMKALVLESYKSFAFRDFEEPVPRDDEALIRVRACAICGSDVHGMDGTSGRRIPPIVMGHEASGVIERPAKGSRLTAGTPVTFDSTVWCGVCAYCRQGRVNLCEDRRVLGVSCAEYRRHGAMADLVAIPERILYPLPVGISFTTAALVEPVSIAVHAVGRAPLELGQTCLVVGAGTIGVLVVQVLRARGAGMVLAVDPVEARRAQAREAGADAVASPEAAPDMVRQATGGRGVDHVWEAVGAKDTLALSLACVRKGGTITLVGNLTPEVSFAQQAAVTREITLYGSCASAGEYPACLDLISRGKVRVDNLVTHVRPLAEGADWFRRLYARESGVTKVVLTP